MKKIKSRRKFYQKEHRYDHRFDSFGDYCFNFYTEIPYIIKYSEPVKIQFSKCNHQLWYVTCNSDGRN